jgi:transcriptional regulator with XRE-family HTH domain
MSPQASVSTAHPFGALLRQWRIARRMSQLALALEANISARHLSFLETGRAQPSRDMVLLLATSLDVPLRERNRWLLLAGYAPIYRETVLTAPEMRPAQRNRSGCQNITLVITSSDGVPCAHGHAPLIATGTLGTDSA